MKIVKTIPLIISLGFLLLGCAHKNFTPMEKYPPATVSMKLKQVSPHVYYAQGQAGIATENQGFISNSGVIITNDGVIIFDALGSPSLAQVLINEIRAITDKPIRKVFISHYHADHIYGTQVFKDLGAEVYAPSGAMQYMNSEVATSRLNERRKSLAPWVDADTHLVTPDHLVSNDMQFEFGGLNFKVIHFGSAHSHGDLSLYVAEDKTILTGDLVFTGRIPFVGGNEIDNWIQKIDVIANVDASVAIPGHGEAFTDKQKGLKLTRDYLVLLRDSMLNAVSEMTSFADAYAAVDWSQFEHLPAFEQGNRGNAYRIYLAFEAKSF